MDHEAEDVDDPAFATPVTKSGGSGINGFFKALRGKGGDKPFESREAGMEQKLITKIENMNFKDQIDMFYTTYSKVCTERTV